jgi:hypothetical protein
MSVVASSATEQFDAVASNKGASPVANARPAASAVPNPAVTAPPQSKGSVYIFLSLSIAV